MGRKRKDADIEPHPDPTVVAVDPGGSTGWCVMSVHPEALVSSDLSILLNILHWGHGEITGEENEQASEILGIIDTWPGSCVLFENFILRSAVSSSELLSPVRITAKVSFGLYLAGKPEMHKQMPSEAKRVATDERLKSWGFYQRTGGQEHARDADRHALTWLRKCKQYEWMRRACWPHLYGEGGEFYDGELPPGAEEDELG